MLGTTCCWPTHIDGHTLDLIITRQSDHLIINARRIDRYLSDHVAVLWSLSSDKPSPTVKNVSYRRLKSIDMTSLNKTLTDSSLCRCSPDDVDGLVACYNTTLNSILDKHAPLKSKVIVERHCVPWLNEEINEAKRKRRKAEKKWRRSRLSSDLDVFKFRRNAVTCLINKTRQEFYSYLIDAQSGDQKKLFTTTMKLIDRSGTRDLPPVPNDLPKYIRDSTCINTFKSFIKTHLFMTLNMY